MLPFIHEERDVVLVVKPNVRPKKYDVILFTNDTQSIYVLHRILKVKPDGFVTYGDNNLKGEVVSNENVLGILDGYYKGEKFISCSSRSYKTKIWLYYHVPLVKRISVYFQRLKFKLKNKKSKHEENK